MRSRMGAPPAAAAAAAKKSSASRNESPQPTEKVAVDEWEIRPGGMLVQKRNPDSDAPAARIPAIRVKVKYGAASHEIYISSQATFGELKKLLWERTGLHPLDQKLIYKDKERDSTAFLDTAGVKDRSKLLLVEDAVAQAKRLLEQRKTEKMEKATKSISAISLEVDKLASKVSALEAIVNKGGRVVENDVVNLTELLMNELVKLDGIVADGDLKQQRRMQLKRVQKYVETLDTIKIKNAQPRAIYQTSKPQPQQEQRQQWQPHYQVNQQQQQQQHYTRQQQQQPKRQEQQTKTHYQQYNHHQQEQQQNMLPQYQQLNQQQETQSQSQLQQKQNLQQQQQQPSAVTTEWEIFDSLFKPSTSTPTSATTTAASTASSTPTTRFDWELF